MLNVNQQAVVDSTASKLLCIAGAGTGKTHTMLQRINKLITTGVDPSTILVLTFTNAAALEMWERYQRDNPDTAVSPMFSTFHAFCYRLIVESASVRSAIGYFKVPQIATEQHTMKRFRQTAKEMSGVKLTESQLADPSKLSESDKREFTIYQKCLHRILKQENYITFDIMCYDICKLFVDNHTSILPYKSKYSYIFVDEFQDTDIKQWDFVRSFGNANICIVGDPLQAIYGFRGADNSIIKALATDSAWEKIKLEENFRSSSKIVDYANAFASTYAEESYKVNMIPHKDSTDCIDVDEIDYTSYRQQNDEILKAIHRLKGSGTIAVLSRSNREVYFNRNLLIDNHLQELLQDDMDIDDTTTQILHICKGIQDLTYLWDYIAGKFSVEDYVGYIRMRELQDAEKIHQYISSRLEKYKVPQQLYNLTRMLHEKYQSYDTAIRDKQILVDIRQSLSISDSEISENVTTLQNYINQLTDPIVQAQQDKPIYVGTIHSVKGLEFDYVILTGVDDTAFPLSLYEENKNLFYVGVTRAKHGLIVLRNL